MQQEENLLMIHNFKELVGPNIVCEKSRILSATYTRIKKPSNNYLIWLKIEIKLINTSTGEQWTLSVIAKTLPKSLENKQFFQIQNALKNEIGIYMLAKPALEAYLREKGIKNGADFLPTPYGGRINLNGNDTIDQNAILILQNYDAIGFTSVSRRIGFNLEISKLILKGLAKFHGTFLGFKKDNPKEFNEKVKQYLGNYYMTEVIERIARKQMIKLLKEKDFPLDVIEGAVATFDKRSIKEANEPWATFIHSNACVNNILVKFEKKSEKPQYMKIMDFSISEYNSPLRDLLFFLFTSVELGILEMHLDDLIDCYYYNFISILKQVDVTHKTLFCRLAFNRELKMAASRSEFYRIVCMLYPTLATRRLDINFNNLEDGIPELQDTVHKRRLNYIVREFDKKGWLYV